jgi:hypothetical protein
LAVLVHHKGADWTADLYQTTFDRAVPDPSDPPAGLIAHLAAPLEGGGWQVIEAWESEDALNGFLSEMVMPVAQEIGAPPFDSQVVELHNSLIA